MPESDANSRRRPTPLPDVPVTCDQSPTGSELRRAQPATWRFRLITMATEIIVICRRVLVRLSLAWPSLPTDRKLLTIVETC